MTLAITPNQHRLILGKLSRILPATPVWAYGSRVKGTARPSSDLDLVVFTTPEQTSQLSDLKEAFDESSLPFRVDVLVWAQIPDHFKTNILKEYVVLVAGNAP